MLNTSVIIHNQKTFQTGRLFSNVKGQGLQFLFVFMFFCKQVCCSRLHFPSLSSHWREGSWQKGKHLPHTMTWQWCSVMAPFTPTNWTNRCLTVNSWKHIAPILLNVLLGLQIEKTNALSPVRIDRVLCHYLQQTNASGTGTDPSMRCRRYLGSTSTLVNVTQEIKPAHSPEKATRD